jgi:2-phosphoglycerate kinase
VAENTDLIIEGAHLVPGFMDTTEFTDAFVVQFIITVDDVDAHRSHFLARAHDNRSRPSERYLEFFDNIRNIQRYIKSLALERSVPVIPSYSLDATLAHVIELVVSRAMQGIPSMGIQSDAGLSNEAGVHELLQEASARRTDN